MTSDSEFGFVSFEEQVEAHRRDGTSFGDDLYVDLNRSTQTLDEKHQKTIEQAREDLLNTLGYLTCTAPPSAHVLRLGHDETLEMIVKVIERALSIRNVIRQTFYRDSHGDEVVDAAIKMSAQERREREEWEEMLMLLYSDPPDEDESIH